MKSRLLILFSCLTLNRCGANMMEAVNAVLSELEGIFDESCIIVGVDTKTWTHHNLEASLPMRFIYPVTLKRDENVTKYQTQDEEIVHFIQNNAKCGVSIFDGTNEAVDPTRVAKLVAPAYKNVALQVGGGSRNPGQDSRRPAFRLLPTSKPDEVQVDIYCPNTTEKWFKFNMWNGESGFRFRFQDPFQFCPHPFFNQLITIAYWVVYAEDYIESRIVELIKEKFKAKGIVNKFGPYVDVARKGLKPGTIEEKAFLGESQFTGSQQLRFPGGPIGQTYPLNVLTQNLYSRKPKSESAWKNVTKVFQPMVWYAIFAGLLSFSIGFAFIYFCYSKLGENSEEIRAELINRPPTHRADWVLLTFFTFTEPDPLPWFTHRSRAGSFLTILWSVSCVFITLGYTSNLRRR